MISKWKIILLVMSIIVGISGIFITIFIFDSRDHLQHLIDTQVTSIRLSAEAIEAETSRYYQNRIKAFVSYEEVPKQEAVIASFARRDREELLRLSTPYLDFFRKENSSFSTFGWVTPDNRVFLRVHNPKTLGDAIAKMRPDVVIANKLFQSNSGYMIAKTGLQYRLVRPVAYNGQHVGTIQFGIKLNLFLDTLHEKLRSNVGMVIDNNKFATISRSKLPSFTGETHTVQSKQLDFFKQGNDIIDWSLAQQKVALKGKTYIIANAFSLKDYKQQAQGNIFVALDISQQVQKLQSRIVFILLITTLLLLLSFFILYSSYGALVQKIINLNQSLEKINFELEDRVRERTARLQKKEKQLHRAQKMEAIGMMAGGVAHDLNNILSGIVSYPELLLLQLPESSELRPPIEAIQESGQRAAVVVADLLTVARGAASIKEPSDIHLLIQEFLESPEWQKIQSSHPDVVCLEEFNAEYSIISCSPVHIKKTVMNLMINAMEAINEVGNIVVSTCNQQLDKPEILDKHDLEPGNYVVLTVQDDGPGIADRDLEHIFEPFYTKKVMGQSGTGLGLAIVWNTVQDHHGKITITSSEKGTCFQLYFPVGEQKEIDQIKDSTLESFTSNNEHILVVDDEPQLRDIASLMLRNIGYHVDSVCSGELAIKFVKENPVDLIVMDMLMEPGINGRQTYEEILKLYPDQKAVVASGFSESEDVKATLQLGAGGFIKKPYSMARLGRVVEEALNG